MGEANAPVRIHVGRAVRFGALLASAAVAFVLVDAAPAAAHNASGPRPTNYRTTIVSMTPRIPGLTLRVVDLGNKLELTNRTGVDVTVLGYFTEPYLRVGPNGVYENLRSPATYLNRTRIGNTPVPEIAEGTGATTPPLWHRVSGSHVTRWHDHRVHWMGTSPPAVVRADPGAFHTINAQWTVVLRYGNRDVVVHGRLDWVPGPSGRPWLPLIAGLFIIGLVVARSKSRTAMVAALVGLVAIDAAHTITAEVARAGSELGKTVQFFGDNWVSVLVWILAVFAVWGVIRRRTEALYGALVAGVMVALVSGLTDLSYLWKSQLPTIGPHALARAEVAAATGLGLGLAVGVLLLLVRSAPRPPAAGRDPVWIERLVAGLDDDAIALESSRLAAADVVPMALAAVADHLAPIAARLGADAVVFVVLAQDDVGTHTWSLVAAPIGSSGLRVQRGRPAPARVELRMTFPAFLQLLGGTLTVDAAVVTGRLVVDGDTELLGEIEPLLGGTARPLPARRGR